MTDKGPYTGQAKEELHVHALEVLGENPLRGAVTIATVPKMLHAHVSRKTVLATTYVQVQTGSGYATVAARRGAVSEGGRDGVQFV